MLGRQCGDSIWGKGRETLEWGRRIKASGRLLFVGDARCGQLGRESGKNGFFEERELERGDGHGENPSFPILPLPFGLPGLPG